MSAKPPQEAAQRDLDLTGFSHHLDTLIRQLPEALCAVFLDAEGETIDLASRMDLFDARIAGAEMAILLHNIRLSNEKLSSGTTLEIRIEGNERSLIVRHVSKGYDLLVVVQGSSISGRVAEMTAATAIALLTEAGLPPPPSYAVLRTVENRPSRAGIYVPTAFEEGGRRRRVVAVLGHRAEPEEVAYLVRLEDGEELVLCLEPPTGKWIRA